MDENIGSKYDTNTDSNTDANTDAKTDANMRPYGGCNDGETDANMRPHGGGGCMTRTHICVRVPSPG